MSKRLREALNIALSLMADEIYDDIDEHGGTPVSPSNRDEFNWLGAFPTLTWREGRDWRRKLARAADDLANDLDAGRLPEPRCIAEEAVLWLAMHREGPAVADVKKWRISQDRWEDAHSELVQDWDIALLWDPSMDGREQPDDDLNRRMGIGDYRPTAWYSTFANMEPRDPGRGFRR